MGAQNDVVVHIEGVLRVPGRVVLGQVQKFEVVVVVFHLRAFHHFVTHAHKDVHHLVHGLVQGIHGAGGTGLAGQRHVDGLRRQPGFLFRPSQLFGTLGDGVFNGRAGLIDHLTHLGPLFRTQFAHAPQYGGKLALFAQYAHANVLQLRGNIRLLYIRQHPLANLFQHILQVLSLLVFP